MGLVVSEWSDLQLAGVTLVLKTWLERHPPDYVHNCSILEVLHQATKHIGVSNRAVLGVTRYYECCLNRHQQDRDRQARRLMRPHFQAPEFASEVSCVRPGWRIKHRAGGCWLG